MSAPRQRSAGLWHLGFGVIGLEIIDLRSVLEAAGQANRLAIAIDLRPRRSADTGATSLTVVGIEDLIADQVGHWLAAGARSGEFAVRLQTLVGLGREGVGGPLREGYLQRRVAWQSDGQVVLELPTSDDGMAPGHTARAMNLTRMRVLINTWCNRNGLTLGDALPSRRQNFAGRQPDQFNPQLNRVPRGAAGSNKTSARILPLRCCAFPATTLTAVDHSANRRSVRPQPRDLARSETSIRGDFGSVPTVPSA